MFSYFGPGEDVEVTEDITFHNSMCYGEAQMEFKQAHSNV